MTLETKKSLIKKLATSGINITPEMLEILLKFKDPLSKLTYIIKETSFVPEFKGHITENILSKISDKEIKKVLRRGVFKDEVISDQIEDATASKSIQSEQALKHPVQNKPEGKKVERKLKNANLSRSPVKEAHSDTIRSTEKKSPKKRKVKATGGTKSPLSFNPVAKDYNAQYNILKDPTHNLYTKGEYEDFYDLLLDKFKRLENLMKKRGEALSANNINSIYRLSSNVEVSILGLVENIRQTKNGHYFLTVEDLTGSVNVLVRGNVEDKELLKTIQSTISDQMLFIRGTFKPGDKRSKGIIYADYVTRIDIPTNFEPTLSPDPISIALLSDTHIGSKEFEEKLWNRFIKFLNGNLGNHNMREIAGRIKYIIINGDLVDGIGIYPSQEEDLLITDIYDQYKRSAEFISQIPDYVQIFYTSGNHEPVRNAIPRPAVPKKYSEELRNLGVKCIGNPCLIETHQVKTLAFHGDSFLDLNMIIPGLENEKPEKTMRELLKCRHLAPVYGKKTQIAPTSTDHLVIEEIPEIFHTGHVHINGQGTYRNVRLFNSGCFQSQTDFMKSFGITPTPGRVPIIELDTLKVDAPLDFNQL